MITNDQHIHKTFIAHTESTNENTGSHAQRISLAKAARGILQRKTIHSLSEQICPIENLKM